MSLFRSAELACPACRAPVRVDLVISVSADRRPDLRAAILDGSFQRMNCQACASRYRIDPEFAYIDLARHQYLGVWPVARRRDWSACAERTQADFDLAFGRHADPEAQALGAALVLRVVFGWPALVEKILAGEAGIDDRTLEIAKVLALRKFDVAPLPGAHEFRLVGLEPDALRLAWVHTDSERLGAGLRVPRTLLAEIEAEPALWEPLRAEVAEGPVVDFQRDMLSA